jgi:signal transduction histidine kinase
VDIARTVPEPGNGSRPYFRLEVRDQGAGIPPDVLPHVFEPFFTTKGVGEGTGLGLSVTHGIIDDHGGWIDVRSDPGRGTVFCVFLPA